MDTVEKLRLTAPCGLDCFNCDLHESNITPELRGALAARLGRQPDAAACLGCRPQSGINAFVGVCPTFQCAVERELDYCFECELFPCRRLAPARDGADRYPHNLKLFNLCRMKAVGTARWAEREAAGARERYFTGRFQPGIGPVLPED